MCVCGIYILDCELTNCCVTCEPHMHPDVYSSFSIMWCMCVSLCKWDIHMGYWTRAVFITYVLRMPPDVCSVLSSMCVRLLNTSCEYVVCVGIYTFEQSASLVNHVYILMGNGSLSIACIRRHIHL